MKIKGQFGPDGAGAEDKLKILTNLSSNLIFEYDIPTDTMYYYNQDGEGNSVFMQDYTNQLLKSDMIHRDDYEILEQFCEDLRKGSGRIHTRFRKKVTEDTYYLLDIRAQGIVNREGKKQSVLGIAGIARDKAWNWQVAELNVERDEATGLYNRAGVRMLIEGKLQNLQDTGRSHLIMVDIDDYCKSFEQTGSMFAKLVMSTCADELKRMFPVGYIGRIGENEFIIYVEDVSLLQIREQIGNMMRLMRRIYEKDMEKNCRIGIAAAQKGIGYDELLLCAQSALVCGNGKEKGCIQIYRKGYTPLLDKVVLTPIQENSKGLLCSTDEELLLYAAELFDKIGDVRNAVRVLSDFTCRFYRIQEIVYFTKVSEHVMIMEYYWGDMVHGEFSEIYMDVKDSEWSMILDGYDRNGIAIYRQQDIYGGNEKNGKSVLSIRLNDKEEESYILFIDTNGDRTWQKEKRNLRRLSWLVFNRMLKVKNEQRETDYAKYMIEHDEKTDLYNYTKFMSEAEQILQKNPDRKYALIYTDFSNFQFLNETYGYVTGDRVLIDFAELLKHRCKHGVLYARVTGDQFISMHEYSNDGSLMEDYVEICDNFCKEINQRYSLCNLMLVSGMSIVDDSRIRIAVHVDNANLARKIAKKNTHVKCEVYSEDMRQTSKRQMEITGNMEEALRNGEFVMYLQPCVNLSDGTISGAEALVRWEKEDGSLIYPDEFIPLFEKNGFVTRIDFEMLRQVLVYQRKIMDRGEKPIPIAVNFSRRHQKNSEYIEKISDMLKEYGVPADYVEIEVTESVFMDDFTVLNRNINTLKQRGILVSIDDFGSGYSSLNILSKVDANVIKLDREFLMSLESNSGEVKKNFLKTLIIMIKQLGFKVLAEGVETEEQEEFLRGTGCEYAQGYLYAKPMSVDDFVSLLSEKKGIM